MELLSHPLRLRRSGGPLSTVREGSDEQHAELIASLVLTHRGERAYVPAYGMEDPTFALFDRAELDAQIRMFAPDISLTLVKVDVLSAIAESVKVSFE